MRGLAWGILALTYSLSMVLALRIVTRSWRTFRSPRIAWMLVAMITGGVLMVVSGSRRGGLAEFSPRGAPDILFLLGAAIAGGGMALGFGSFMLRIRALESAMDRVDGYVQGSQPTPFPMDDATARADLAKVVSLLEDPALWHRCPVDVRGRVAELAARIGATG